MKSTWQIFRTQMSIYQSKAKLAVNILFGKAPILLTQKYGEAGKGLYGNGDSMFNSCP